MHVNYNSRQGIFNKVQLFFFIADKSCDSNAKTNIKNPVVFTLKNININFFLTFTAMNICGILIHCCVRRKRRFKLGRFVIGLDMDQSNQNLTERNSMTNFNSQNTISAIECAPLK